MLIECDECNHYVNGTKEDVELPRRLCENPDKPDCRGKYQQHQPSLLEVIKGNGMVPSIGCAVKYAAWNSMWVGIAAVGGIAIAVLTPVALTFIALEKAWTKISETAKNKFGGFFKRSSEDTFEDEKEEPASMEEIQKSGPTKYIYNEQCPITFDLKPERQTTDAVIKMASKDFNPIDHARPPREEGWKEETEQIAELLHQRGDLRIGQLLINAIRKDMERAPIPEPEKDVAKMTDEEVEEYMKKLHGYRDAEKAAIEQKIWDIEADELLKLLENFIGEHQE